MVDLSPCENRFTLSRFVSESLTFLYRGIIKIHSINCAFKFVARCKNDYVQLLRHISETVKDASTKLRTEKTYMIDAVLAKNQRSLSFILLELY